MVQPCDSSDSMRGLRPRRAAIAALKATIDLRVAQQLLLARIHAAAMGADHLLVEEAEIGEILGRQPVAMRLHRRDLAPDLVEMDGHPGAELLLQRAQVLEQLGRAHVGRPGRDGDADAAVGLAVPFGEGLLDRLDVLLAERTVELVGRRIADRGADPVVGALAEQEAQARLAQRLGVVVDVVGILEHEGDAAAQALERAELRHHAPLVGRHVGQRDRRQAAGEGRLVRRREILEHAACQGHGEMGVGVGEARHHHAGRARRCGRPRDSAPRARHPARSRRSSCRRSAIEAP